MSSRKFNKNVLQFWDNVAINTSLQNKKSVGMLTEGNDYNENIRDYEEKKYLKKILPINTKSVLEIGCGGGRFCEFFVEQGIKYHGIDISNEMIKIANKTNVKHVNSGLAKFEKVNFLDTGKIKVDLILLGGVLQYIEDNTVDLYINKIKEHGVKIIITKDTIYEKSSKKLTNEYPCIYRTRFDYNKLFAKHNFNLKKTKISYGYKRFNSFFGKISSTKIINDKYLKIIHKISIILIEKILFNPSFLFTKEYKKNLKTHGHLNHYIAIYSQ